MIDPQYGVSLARRFHYNKPLTILDIPESCRPTALDMPDPETPVGARGVGEPPVGAGYGAVTQRDCRRYRRGCVPPRAGDRRHRADVAGAWAADARTACGHICKSECRMQNASGTREFRAMQLIRMSEFCILN